MENVEWKYKNLEAHLRYNAKNLVLSIEAQNAESYFDVFIVLYKWIIMDNLFLTPYENKNDFERYNIEEFQHFFMDQNIHYESLLPSYKMLRTFFWHVMDSGFEKHIKTIAKMIPDFYSNKVNPNDGELSNLLNSFKGISPEDE